MKRFFKTTAIAATLMIALSACGNKDGSNGNDNLDSGASDKKGKYDTLVVGVNELNGDFLPIFSTSDFDKDVYNQVTNYIISTDPDGSPVADGATFEQPLEYEKDGKTYTDYVFTIIDGLKFSDGTDVTTDDIIFTYKVLLDPFYDGSHTLYTTPIVGMNEYRYDDPNYAEKIVAIEVEAENISENEIMAEIEKAANSYVEQDAEEIADDIGFKNEDGLTGNALKDELTKLTIQYLKDNKYDDYKEEAIFQKKSELTKQYVTENLSKGTANVPEIEGIQKIDDKTIKITIEGIDPKAIWNLGEEKIHSEKFYGTNDRGETWKKGDLSIIKEKNNIPFGSGPYVFESFENNVVSLKANPYYFKGEPIIKNLKFQVTNENNKIEGVRLGDFDITDPSASIEAVEEVKNAGFHYTLTDNLGYGYIGISASRVPDVNVRKGLMHLMNRHPAIETYYGTELASVLERPMSQTIAWAYPSDAKEFYEFSPEKALECFKAAGYEQVTNGGSVSLEKDGKQLRYEIYIGGGSTMNHPSAPILTQMKLEMDKLGAALEIQDVPTNILFDKYQSDQADMWVAAWASDQDPDMFQLYHSQSPGNYYKIKDNKLDDLMSKARQTNDQSIRKALYKEALDIIMDWAIEMPVYQRKNMIIFNPEVIKVETLPETITPFYKWYRDIEKLELN